MEECRYKPCELCEGFLHVPDDFHPLQAVNHRVPAAPMDDELVEVNASQESAVRRDQPAEKIHVEPDRRVIMQYTRRL